mmetsp:Transcript_24698/g.57530  ORF Transcript_24698/g.57530 Transcript_24698/m.57530 type:complete len:267 (-) Transcript_24698:368-1168(-)
MWARCCVCLMAASLRSPTRRASSRSPPSPACRQRSMSSSRRRLHGAQAMLEPRALRGARHRRVQLPRSRRARVRIGLIHCPNVSQRDGSHATSAPCSPATRHRCLRWLTKPPPTEEMGAPPPPAITCSSAPTRCRSDTSTCTVPWRRSSSPTAARAASMVSSTRPSVRRSPIHTARPPASSAIWRRCTTSAHSPRSPPHTARSPSSSSTTVAAASSDTFPSRRTTSSRHTSTRRILTPLRPCVAALVSSTRPPIARSSLSTHTRRQ